jgi:flagellar hook-length control protein FliK
VASKRDYAGREIFTKPETGTQGPAIKGEKLQETAGNPVAKRPLKTESDIKGAQDLFSTRNSGEITPKQVSQAKEAVQLQRPLQLNILSQVVEKAVMNLRAGQTSINIDLKPDHLGRLRMHISTENNKVVVRILTEVPLVKEIMETNLSQLRTELQNHGLDIEKFDVFLNDGSYQDSAEHDRSLFGKTENEAGEIIRQASIHEDSGSAAVFAGSGKGPGRIDCMA